MISDLSEIHYAYYSESELIIKMFFIEKIIYELELSLTGTDSSPEISLEVNNPNFESIAIMFNLQLQQKLAEYVTNQL